MKVLSAYNFLKNTYFQNLANFTGGNLYQANMYDYQHLIIVIVIAIKYSPSIHVYILGLQRYATLLFNLLYQPKENVNTSALLNHKGHMIPLLDYLATSMEPAPAPKKSVSLSISGLARMPAQITYNKNNLQNLIIIKQITVLARARLIIFFPRFTSRLNSIGKIKN